MLKELCIFEGVVVSGVRVSIASLGVETLTTERGSYRFKHLPAGVYSVVFERDGFLRLTVPVAIVANQRKDLEVVLVVDSTMKRVG